MTEDEIREGLDRWFGHDDFRPGKYAPIEAVANGRGRALLRQMVRYCDTPGCRHAFILDYFGEDVRGDKCGGCDRCGPRKMPDPPSETQWIIVQKVLSASTA